MEKPLAPLLEVLPKGWAPERGANTGHRRCMYGDMYQHLYSRAEEGHRSLLGCALLDGGGPTRSEQSAGNSLVQGYTRGFSST